MAPRDERFFRHGPGDGIALGEVSDLDRPDTGVARGREEAGERIRHDQRGKCLRGCGIEQARVTRPEEVAEERAALVRSQRAGAVDAERDLLDGRAEERQRAEHLRLQQIAFEKEQAERAHLQAFIDRFKAKATKAKQAQSRVKALARMQPIADQVEDRVPPFALPDPRKMLASPLIRLEKAAAGYGNGPPILSGIDLRIDQDDRIALLGQNGNGKSTFAKLIGGRLAPLSGEVWGVAKVEVGYFAQHQLDELNPLSTPYDYIVALMPDATEAQRRTRLGTLGFGADKADTRCGNLSGGEKARLLLALTAFHGPNILILDEPTNHLDVDSREALIHALNEYQGAVILISHDLAVVREISHNVLVLYLGRAVEYGPGEAILTDPRHPYTKALLAAAPTPDPDVARNKPRVRLVGDLPSPLDTRASLRFLKSRVIDDPDATQYRPQWIEVGQGHFVAEHDPPETAIAAE